MNLKGCVVFIVLKSYMKNKRRVWFNQLYRRGIMKNKIEFSADGREICRFLTVVFILTLIIGIATAYGYYIGSNIQMLSLIHI